MKRLLFIPLLLIASTAFAAPTISSFNQDTGVITCVDAGTRADNNATTSSMLNSFDDFESGNIDDVYVTEAGNNRYYIESIVNNTNSSYSIRRDKDGTISSFESATPVSNDGFFTCFDIKMAKDFSVTDNTAQIKFYRIYTTNSGDFPYPNHFLGKHEFYRISGSTDRSFVNLVERNPETADGGYYGEETSLDDGEWHTIAAWFKPSTGIGNNDGIYFVWLDGTKIISDSALYTDNGSNNSWGELWEILGYYHEMAEDCYFDNLCMDYSLSQVFIGDASTFATCTKIALQDPQSWSANSITIDFNQRQFNDGDTAYLFIIDSDGTASTGYEITIGSSTTKTQLKDIALNNITVR